MPRIEQESSIYLFPLLSLTEQQNLTNMRLNKCPTKIHSPPPPIINNEQEHLACVSFTCSV